MNKSRQLYTCNSFILQGVKLLFLSMQSGGFEESDVTADRWMSQVLKRVSLSQKGVSVSEGVLSVMVSYVSNNLSMLKPLINTLIGC